jgi:hypothetical protein
MKSLLRFKMKASGAMPSVIEAPKFNQIRIEYRQKGKTKAIFSKQRFASEVCHAKSKAMIRPVFLFHLRSRTSSKCMMKSLNRSKKSRKKCPTMKLKMPKTTTATTAVQSSATKVPRTTVVRVRTKVLGLSGKRKTPKVKFQAVHKTTQSALNNSQILKEIPLTVTKICGRG